MTLLVEMSFPAFNPEPGLQHHGFHPPTPTPKNIGVSCQDVIVVVAQRTIP